MMPVQHAARCGVGKHRFTNYEIAVNQHVSDPYRQRVGISVIRSDRHACRVEEQQVQERMEKGSLVLWERSAITFLMRVYSNRACHPRSRPYPLCFTPPKGAWAAALR